MADVFRAFPDLVRHPLGGGGEIVYGLTRREAHVASALQAQALRRCTSFATLDQHASRLARELSVAPASARASLDDLVRVGLLVSASELVQRVRSGADHADDAAPSVTTLGVPTWRRPESLRASLASYVDDALRHRRSLAYVVADSVWDDAEAAATRAIVAGVAMERGVTVAYAGPAEKARYAEALATRAGVPVELARFALLGDPRISDGTGGNRNALLLDAIGEASVQVDDDTRCRLFAAPEPRAGLAITSGDDPTELWPFDRDTCSPVAAPKAFVALHEELLGRTLAGCARARSDGLDLDGATAMLFRRIEARGGRVVVTQSGGAGDAGTGTTAHLFLLEGRARARLCADEATYVRARTTRQALRVAPRVSVSDGASCMSMGLGLDARAMLPPFAVVLRNGEAVFSTTLRRTHDDALLGFVPWAVEHTPPETRGEAPEVGIAAFTTLGVNDLLRLLVVSSRVEPGRDDPGPSLRALGEALVRWASLPSRDFEEIVRIQVLRARSLDLLLLASARDRHRGEPSFWGREIDGAIATLRAAMTSPDLARPTDLPTGVTFPELVRRHGELLRAWPDLWNAARELRAAGVRVSAPLA